MAEIPNESIELLGDKQTELVYTLDESFSEYYFLFIASCCFAI